MWFHELNPYRCAVLRKNFPTATVVESDIRTLAAEDVPGGQAHFFSGIGGFGLACEWTGWKGELWTGGFPCTDISCAGKGAGLDGRNSGLWFEWLRLIRARRPVRLLIENVPALRTRGYDRIQDALDEIGYAVRAIVVGAKAVSAPHRRNRVWIVATMGDSGIATGERNAGGLLAPETGERGTRLADGYCAQRSPNASDSGEGWDLADPHRRRRGSGGRKCVDESEAERRGREPAGSVQLAVALGEGPQERIEQPAWDQCETLERSGDGLALSGVGRQQGDGLPPRSRAEGQGAFSANRGGAVVHAECEPCGSGNNEPIGRSQGRTPTRWPMPPGPRQHEWEARRLVESGVGLAVDGLPRRLAGFARRNALQALGDSIVPQVAAEILRAWKDAELTIT